MRRWGCCERGRVASNGWRAAIARPSVALCPLASLADQDVPMPKRFSATSPNDAAHHTQLKPIQNQNWTGRSARVTCCVPRYTSLPRSRLIHTHPTVKTTAKIQKRTPPIIGLVPTLSFPSIGSPIPPSVHRGRTCHHMPMCATGAKRVILTRHAELVSASPRGGFRRWGWVARLASPPFRRLERYARYQRGLEPRRKRFAQPHSDAETRSA